MIKRYLPIALCFMAILIASCGTGNPPQTSDWCYRFDFESDDYGFTVTTGGWADSVGFFNDEDGNLEISYSQTNWVNPQIVIIGVHRAVTSDMTVDATAAIFGTSGTFENQFIPGYLNDDQQLPLTPVNPADAGREVEITLHTTQAVYIRSLEVRGLNANPFPESNCSNQPTPTPEPVTATNTPDPLELTLTPSNTFTPSHTLTPSFTFTPSQTFTPSPTFAGGEWFHEIDFTVCDGGFGHMFGDLSDWTSGVGWVGDVVDGWVSVGINATAYDYSTVSNLDNWGIRRAEMTFTWSGNQPEGALILGLPLSDPSSATSGTITLSRGSILSGRIAGYIGSGLPFEPNNITGFINLAPFNLYLNRFGGGSVIATRYRVWGYGLDPIEGDGCETGGTATPTPSPTTTESATVTRSATSTGRPTRTPVNPASPTPAQQCKVVNFDDLNQLTVSYPTTGDDSGSHSIVAGELGIGNAVRFSSTLNSGDYTNETALFLTTLPSWSLQELRYRVRYVLNGSDLGTARYLWWNPGGGPIRVPQDLGGLDTPNQWFTEVVPFGNAAGYSGVGIEYSLNRSLVSHAEIDNITLCYVLGPTPTPTRSRTLSIPTLDVTPTFITATATLDPSRTLIPFPTALPTWDLTTTPEGGPEAEQVDLLTGISDGIGGFFNWIGNTVLSFFDWLGSLIRWLLGTAANFITLIGNLIGLILSILLLPIRLLIEFLNILGLIVAIILHVLFLFGQWVSQLITTAQTLFNTWYLATPQAIPFLPQCTSNPTASDICAVYYILSNTVLSGTLGILFLPLLLILIDLAIILQFIVTVRNLVKKAEGITR